MPRFEVCSWSLSLADVFISQRRVCFQVMPLPHCQQCQERETRGSRLTLKRDASLAEGILHTGAFLHSESIGIVSPCHVLPYDVAFYSSICSVVDECSRDQWNDSDDERDRQVSSIADGMHHALCRLKRHVNLGSLWLSGGSDFEVRSWGLFRRCLYLTTMLVPCRHSLFTNIKNAKMKLQIPWTLERTSRLLRRPIDLVHRSMFSVSGPINLWYNTTSPFPSFDLPMISRRRKLTKSVRVCATSSVAVGFLSAADGIHPSHQSLKDPSTVHLSGSKSSPKY